MGRALQALIDPTALRHNLNIVKNLAPNSKVIAMVKADSYGHGLVPVARALVDADAFGVACIEEAIALRRAGVSNRIILMQGFFSTSELADIVNNQFEVVIHSAQQLNLLQTVKKFVRPLWVWIKINTGMNRLGFEIDTAVKAYKDIKSSSNYILKGVLTHFASSDEVNNPLTKHQIDLFKNFCDKNISKDIDRSMANSAGVINWQDSHADWVRPGLMLYGISPISGKSGVDLGLKPAMQLETNIIAIQKIKKGDGIGYNHKFIASKDMYVGIIAVGYADGLSSMYGLAHSSINQSTVPVLYQGRKVPFIGKVSMDMAAIDLTDIDIEKAKVDDKVVLWGEGLPVEEVAQSANLIPYELITSLGNRVARKQMHNLVTS